MKPKNQEPAAFPLKRELLDAVEKPTIVLLVIYNLTVAHEIHAICGKLYLVVLAS